MMRFTNVEQAYAALVNTTADEGQWRETRNAKTKAMFGVAFAIDDLKNGYFPIPQGRKFFIKGVMGEFAAMLKGPKSLKDFEDEGCNYSKKWAKADGTIAVDYGNKWLDFHGYNQLEALVDGLKNDPYSRRHIITGWDPSNLENLDLPCCHLLYQWYVTNDGHLDMIWYQRSVDVMVGMPSDIMVAAIWTILLAKEVGLKPGRLNFSLGDVHIYESHMEQVKSYLDFAFEAGTKLKQVGYKLNPNSELLTFKASDLELVDYNPLSKMKFEVHE